MVQEVNENLNSVLQKNGLPEILESIYYEPDHIEEITIDSNIDCLNETISGIKHEEIAMDSNVDSFVDTISSLKPDINNEILNGKNYYKCSLCLEVYQEAVNFKIHRMCHIELYCDVCHEIFDEENEKQEHSCRSTQENTWNENSKCNKVQIDINLGQLSKNVGLLYELANIRYNYFR